MSNSLLIDLNRGVIVKKHARTGMQVFMYRDQPGVYLNAFAKPVSENLAKEVGFDVETLGRKKLAKEKLGAAMQAIEAELAVEHAEERKIIAQRGGYNVVDLGLGRARIEDDEGHSLTETPMAQDYALKLLDELAGPEVDAAQKVAHNAPASNEKKKEKAHGGTAS